MPTISTQFSSVPVSIFQAFNLTLQLQFPSGFNNYLQIDAIPTQNTTDLSPRVKVCSVVVASSGENLPCPKCMNTGVLKPYAQNTSFTKLYDSFSWYVGSVRKLSMRTTLDNPNVDTMTFVFSFFCYYLFLPF